MAYLSFKPTLRVTRSADIAEVGNGKIYNPVPVGPRGFLDLLESDYQRGFSMATFGEVVDLVAHTDLRARHMECQEIATAISRYGVIGNTAVLYGDKGMYVQDRPKIRKGQIVMEEGNLRQQVRGEKGEKVSFSEDKSVRFVPYNILANLGQPMQSPSHFAHNPGVIALVGSVEVAESLAAASKQYESRPCFQTVRMIPPKNITVPWLNDSGGQKINLDVISRESRDLNRTPRYSFGTY